jgi:diguanylate cyclase (GGDEF)-like protein
MGDPDEPKTGAPIPILATEQMARELARVDRALRTLSAGNRALLRASTEQELLEQMCRIIVETGGYRMACVAYAEHDEQKSIRWLAGVGLDMSMLTPERYTWADTELGRTAVGTAIRTGAPVVGRHILTDPAYDAPAYAAIRKHALKQGYASATALPLRLDGQILGGLVMGAVEPDAFTAEEVKLLSELADDLAYGIANLRTAAQHREAQATIARLAYYDSLTCLPTRALLVERLEEGMQVARDQHHSMSLLHLEVGRFHEINKVLGYRAGDELIQALARRLQDEVKDKETLARVGEAEFALLLPHGGAEHAIEIAQRLVSRLGEPVEVAGFALDARVGIGIALFPGHATDAELLIRRASAAMHQARPARGGYALYTGGQEQEDRRRLALMGDFYRATKNGELRLYCQPKIDIATGKVCGAEALVRWQHPQHGIVSPTEFIHLAEQAGTITPLTTWMLEAAFQQSYTWHEAGLQRPMAVNLSAHDLYDPRLIDRVRGLFSTWGIDPPLIQFELTESALMADPVCALETLTRLKRLDVELFIDDYGTGYSSLGYLQKLPVDAVKIDQSFVSPMVASGDSQVIVCSTIELSHNLGMKVVAEGVESRAIWDQLETLGCDVAQGFFISRPMPAADFQAWESKWRQVAN